MKININGVLAFDDGLDYNKIHRLVEDNTYNGLGDGIKHHIINAVHSTDWGSYQPYNFDLVKNWEDVKGICGENAACYMDSFNWSIMNKSELTADIYKFIAYRAGIVRDALQNNLVPSHHFEFGGIFNMIDWHFVLDCISLF